MRGYVRLPKNILTLSGDSKELKVYIILKALSYANHGGFVKISICSLAIHTGLSEESVKRAVKGLSSKGLLMCAKTYINGQRRANRYKIAGREDLRTGYILLDLSLVNRFKGDKLTVYLALCRHANRHGFAYISERALAAELGLSRNTVRKHVAELEAENALDKYMRYYAKHRPTRAKRCFAYHINDVEDMISPCPDATQLKPEPPPSICYVSSEDVISLIRLCVERLIPLRVPP